MKTNKTPICITCMARIENYGFICLEIMHKVCTDALNFDLYYYDERDCPRYINTIVKFLESKRLLVTTDMGSYIGIRPNINQEECMEGYFCWCDRSKL